MTVKCSKRDEHLLVGLRLVVQFREKSAYWDIRSCERNINRIAWIRKSFGAFKERLEFVRQPRQEISFGWSKLMLVLFPCQHAGSIFESVHHLFQIISVGQSLCGWSIQIMRRLGSKRISKYSEVIRLLESSKSAVSASANILRHLALLFQLPLTQLPCHL